MSDAAGGAPSRSSESGWPLTGREQELAFVRRAVDGSGSRGVLLAGGTGVGKSRLAREACEQVGRGGRHVEWLTATISTRDIPLAGAWHLLPGDLGGSASQAEILRAAQRGLSRRAAGRAAVIVADDAHLLDGLSVALVHRIVTAGEASLVATVRSGEPVPELLVGLYRDGIVDRLELQPLAVSEVTGLLEAVLGGQVAEDTAHRLWSVGAGNVLYLRELVLDALDAGALSARGGLWRWSGSVGEARRLTEVVGNRLAGLDAGESRLLDLLAIGEPLPLTIVEQLSDPAVVGALERRSLIEVREGESGLEVHLGHPVYGEVARGRVPLLRRRELCRVLAEAFVMAGPSRPPDLLRIAVWRVESGTAADAAALAQAAELANRRGDAATGVRLAAASLEIGWSFPAELQLGAARYELGDVAGGEQILSDLSGREPDDRGRQDLAYYLMRARFYGLGQLEAAVTALSHAEAALADPDRRGMVRAWRAMVLAHGGRLDEAGQLAAELTETANPKVKAAALGTLTVVRRLSGRVGEALALSEECVALAGRSGRARVAAYIGRVLALQADGQLAAAENLLGELSAAVRAGTGSPADQATITTLRGAGALLAGRPATALRLLREATDDLRTHDEGGFLSWCLALQVEAAALVGDGAATQVDACAVSAIRTFAGDTARARVWARVTAGDRQTAATALVELAEVLSAGGMLAAATRCLHDAVRLEEPSEAVLSRLAGLAGQVDGRIGQATARQARALLNRDLDELEWAATDFERAETLLFAAEAWTRASTLARELGLTTRTAAAARHRSRLLVGCEQANTPALAGVDDPAALTVREREVAALAAAGLTNKQIAVRLTTSVRTVEGHLYQVFGKLGITARTELTDRLDPISPARSPTKPSSTFGKDK